MCGIFAWAGKSPKKFSRNKFDILGMYNQSRGVHSCGVSIDGDIKVGVDDLKLYFDFISNADHIADPINLPVVIGHTRQATGGSHNIDNAHPFGYGESKHGYGFIGVHNGTLVNHEELAEQYKISPTVTRVNNKSTVTRHKIDSEILLECIYRSNDFKVLSNYLGAAALVFYNVKEPNVIYCYHGKSKEYDTDKDVKEERPLYYYKETRNSLYISSIRQSLRAIASDDEKIGEFEHNIIYKITDGNIDKAVKFTISRANCHQKDTWYGTQWGNGATSNYGINKSKAWRKRDRVNNKPNKLTRKNDQGDFNIFAEKPRLSAKIMGRRPYFHKLRWFRNGHLITGIYVYLTDYGFHYVGHNVEDATKSFDNLRGRAFNPIDGTFGDYSEDPNDYVPFCVSQDEIPLKFIYEGVLLKQKFDYSQSIDFEKNKKKFTWVQLSHAAVHPIIDIETYKPHDQQNVMWNGVLHTGKFSVMGSFRNYEFKNGNLTNFEDIGTPTKFYFKTEENKPKVIQLPLNLNEERPNDTTILDNTGCSCEDMTCIDCANEIDEVLVLDTIDKVFEGPLMALPLAKEELTKYLPSKKAKDAIDIIDTFTDFVMDLT